MNYFNTILLKFNFYYDIRFWVFFLVAVVIFRLLMVRRWTRDISIGVFNILFLLALPRFTPLSFLFLLVITIIVYFLGYYLNRGYVDKSGSRKVLVAAGAVSALILILAFFKYNFLQEIFFEDLLGGSFKPSDFIFIIGISYSSFKLMHFVIECYKGQIENLNILYFFNFIFFFPSFISGPINRYNHFSSQMDFKGRKLSADLKSGLERIVHGLFKKFVLSTLVFPYAITNISGSISDMSGFRILIGLYAYTLYFYFDFAGYSDLAIGSARVMGIELPENFNNPFMKRNIQQLWANWHISLTTWLTDYIFWPLSRKLRNYRYFKKRPITLSNISIIVTFVICGMWHGDTFNFVVWGFYQGLGLAVLNIYRKQKRKIKNKRIRRYFRSRYSEAVGVIGTFNFFALGILLFALRVDDIMIIFTRFFHFFFK